VYKLSQYLDEGLSVAASFDSTEILDISQLERVSLQVTIAGGSSPTGTYKLQVSNDIPGSSLVNFTPTNWTDLASGSLAFTDNATKNTGALTVSARWLRGVWTAGSGTGDLTAAVYGIGPS
jgi:hypothetical protein